MSNSSRDFESHFDDRHYNINDDNPPAPKPRKERKYERFAVISNQDGGIIACYSSERYAREKYPRNQILKLTGTVKVTV